MATYMIRKLEQFVRLSTDDKAALSRLASHAVRDVAPREDVIREGDRPRAVNIILDGFACRYKSLEDGRRQILNFFVPGDVCDPRVFILKEMDHSISSLSALKVAEAPGEAIIELTERFPRVAQALWWSTLVDEAIAREWLVNVGQRSATERMAHLLCELFLRMKGVGLVSEDSCDVPMTQTDLADALGLSAVHTNRTLQELRSLGLIVWKGKRLTIPDLDSLKSLALFNPNYLHLDRVGQALDASER